MVLVNRVGRVEIINIRCDNQGCLKTSQVSAYAKPCAILCSIILYHTLASFACNSPVMGVDPLGAFTCDVQGLEPCAVAFDCAHR